MVRELEGYGWTMFIAPEMKQQSMSALMADGACKIVITLKMLVFSATVSVIFRSLDFQVETFKMLYMYSTAFSYIYYMPCLY